MARRPYSAFAKPKGGATTFIWPAIVAKTMMFAPFFFQSMRELHLKAIVLTACPVILLLILSWSWNLKAMDIAAEIED